MAFDYSQVTFDKLWGLPVEQVDPFMTIPQIQTDVYPQLRAVHYPEAAIARLVSIWAKNYQTHFADNPMPNFSITERKINISSNTQRLIWTVTSDWQIELMNNTRNPE